VRLTKYGSWTEFERFAVSGSESCNEQPSSAILSILKPDLKIFFCFFLCLFFAFLFFLHVCSFFCFFSFVFSNLGLDWVLLFFFRGFETSHWITVKKDFDKV
jgi:hypothetical protein